MREREAAHEHGTGGGRPERVRARVVGERRAAQLPRPGGHLGEASGAARLDRQGLAERGEREPVAIRLLEAGEAVVGVAGA